MFYQILLGTLLATVCMAQGEQTESDSDGICADEDCKTMAAEVKAQRGACDACSNFYDYVCGNWEGDRELKDKSLKSKAVQDLIGLLKNASTPTTEHVNATDKLLLAYTSCTSQGEKKEVLKTSIKTVLDKYGLGPWPVVSDENKKNKAYQEILEKAGPLPLFRCIASEERKPEKSTIVMTKPAYPYLFDVAYSLYSPPVSSRDDVEETTDYDYGQYDDKSEEAYTTFIKDTISLLNETVTEAQKLQVAEEIIQFEKNLSEFASKAQEKLQNMTIEELNGHLGDAFQMEKILKKDFEAIQEPISSTTQVEVRYLDYYKNAVNFIKEPKMTTSLVNYIAWTKIRGMAEAVATPLHEIYLAYKNKTYTTGLDEIDKSNDTDLRCVYQLLQKDIMYSAAASYYSSAKFDETARTEVTKILYFINSTFRHVVMNNTWMSQDIKDKAIKAMDQMTYVIGYPEWFLNSTIMDSLYKFVPKTGAQASFVEHFHWLQENDRLQKLLLITSSYVNKTNEDVILRSHALYRAHTNTLGYPAAALATHYRKPPIPRAMNFGTVGVVLAGLYTYAVDRFHGFTKEKKVTEDFWDEDTKNRFCSQSQCLNNTEECKDTEQCHSSRYEHLDDYFGVRVSHKAMMQSKGNYSGPLLLEGEEFDSEDKIFLLAFGSLYCPYRVNEKKAKIQARADETEEDKFPKRLNEVVSIYSLFNKTFQCNGTLSDTCSLMPVENAAGSGQC